MGYFQRTACYAGQQPDEKIEGAAEKSGLNMGLGQCTCHQQQKVRHSESGEASGDVPGHSSEDNQVGFLLVVADDCILHVTVKAHTGDGAFQTATSTSLDSSSSNYSYGTKQ